MTLTWQQLADRILRLPPEVRQQEAVVVDIYTDEYLPVSLGVDEEGGEDDEPTHKHAFLHRLCDGVEAIDSFEALNEITSRTTRYYQGNTNLP